MSLARHVGALLVASSLLGPFAAVARAASGPADVREQRDVEAIERRIDELEQEIERLRETPAPPQTPEAMSPETREELDEVRSDMDDLLDALPDVTLSGEIDFSYGYNFDRPSDGLNRYRAFDREDDTFRFDLARLTVATRVLEQAEARIDVLFGETAKALGEVTNGSLGDGAVQIEQAFATYRFGLGEGLDVTVGKFASLLGSEVPAAPDNDHYSRSLVYALALPFTHTGLVTRSTFLDGRLDAAVGVVNGWDDVRDRNHGKTVIGRIGTRIGDRASLAVAGTWGAEQEDAVGAKRGVVDVVATVRPFDRLSVLASFDYGAEEDVLLDAEAGRVSDVSWLAYGGGVRYDAARGVMLAVRGERFDDRDGARTGTAQALWEVTGTVAYELVSNLLVRGEYRHDASDEPTFDDGGTPSKQQDTVSVDISYRF